MKTLITTLNAKYIHTSLALRLLYVSTKDEHDVSFREYTIKDQIDEIVTDLLKQSFDVIAFSCYIWNVEMIGEICIQLKKKKEQCIIIWGGPEVTYDPKHFLDTYPIDYVMSGEGEVTFGLLLKALETNQPVRVAGVSSQTFLAKEVTQTPLSFIEQLDSPYGLKQDFETMGNRILYFETSRGCPYQCQYCLSSLEQGLRFYSKDYLIKQMDLILQSPAKVIKVLDRSFNAKKEHALFVLQYLFTHYKEGQQFQFEINADVFPMELVDFINAHAPKGLLRFEIGIQSTYEPTNQAVKRMQDFKRLSEVVTALMKGGKCDLHLDLIAGLPFETYERFGKSFDDVFAFRAKELQLGFLKLLRGTSLRNNADEFGYIYDVHTPYEMLENHWLKPNEIHKIHLGEEMLEKYWNSGRFPNTMKLIMDDVDSPFHFFVEFGEYYEAHGYSFHQYQLFDLYAYLDTFLNGKYRNEMILEYLAQCKTKPKRWYAPTITQVRRHEIIELLSKAYGCNRNQLYRYALLEEFDDCFVVAIYQNYACELKTYQKADAMLRGM